VLTLTKWILITGGIFSALAIIIGAFGAHALKPILSSSAMDWIDTGVYYQSIHALAIIACGLVPGKPQSKTAVWFIIGIILFCGSLYFMALTGIRGIGIVTPIGGISLIAGWIAFCWTIWSSDTT